MNHLLFIALLASGIMASSVSCANPAPPQLGNTAEGKGDNNNVNEYEN